MPERTDGIHHTVQIAVAQVPVKRQPEQAIADVLGHRVITRPPAHLSPHSREVKGQVVEDAHDALRLQVRNERLAHGK
jgi:hypothetical protein